MTADNCCMDYVLRWGGDAEDLSVLLLGTATVEGLDAWVQATLADRRWRPPMRVLVDHRLLDWGQISATDIERRADMLARDAERIGHSFIAAVTNGNLNFGLMRMEQVQVEAKVQYEFEVFRSIDDAREWLRQVRAEDPSQVRVA